MALAHDGIVSRHLNRRLSGPLARALRRTPATPNQVSAVSFGIALFSLALFIEGHNVWAGVAAQASSVVDGVDGELARLKSMATPFGGFFDAVLDRYADAAILGGLTYWSVTFEERVSPELTVLVGALAIVGSLVISYTRARAEASLAGPFQGLVSSLGARDARLLLVMVGAVAGQGFILLAALAALSNLVVAWRVALARRDATGD